MTLTKENIELRKVTFKEGDYAGEQTLRAFLKGKLTDTDGYDSDQGLWIKIPGLDPQFTVEEAMEFLSSNPEWRDSAKLKEDSNGRLYVNISNIEIGEVIDI